MKGFYTTSLGHCPQGNEIDANCLHILSQIFPRRATDSSAPGSVSEARTMSEIQHYSKVVRWFDSLLPHHLMLRYDTRVGKAMPRLQVTMDPL